MANMMADTPEVLDLYSKRILDLAAHVAPFVPLTEPYLSGYARSPLCGSSVRVQLRLEHGVITAYAQKPRCCALGQAAAALIADTIIGQTVSTVAAGREQLAQMLQGGPEPAAPWARLSALRPARDFPNRHPSVLLTFDAILDAVTQA